MRPVVLPDDEDFLKKLYFTTRDEEFAMMGLPGEQLEMLLEMQYRAQKMQYDAEYPGAEHVIILWNEEPVGRLMSRMRETALDGIDLAILTEHRSKGIGAVVMRRWLMDKADAAGVPFIFSVVKSNHKAIKFYRSLGIAFTGETVSHYLLEWRQKQA